LAHSLIGLAGTTDAPTRSKPDENQISPDEFRPLHDRVRIIAAPSKTSAILKCAGAR